MDINFNSENSEITINIPQSQLKNFILEIYDKENKLVRRVEDIKENKMSLKDLNEGVYKDYFD
jgi:tRNA G10  N-methylase Trm11